jgi:hypothetical protein
VTVIALSMQQSRVNDASVGVAVPYFIQIVAPLDFQKFSSLRHANSLKFDLIAAYPLKPNQ